MFRASGGGGGGGCAGGDWAAGGGLGVNLVPVVGAEVHGRRRSWGGRWGGFRSTREMGMHKNESARERGLSSLRGERIHRNNFRVSLPK